MFTAKFYSDNGYRQRIVSAESFTILRGDNGTAEITLHQKNQTDDARVDINWDEAPRDSYMPPVYQKVIIENATGKTTEIIALGCNPNIPPSQKPKEYAKAA
jgi:hypothetical protein